MKSLNHKVKKVLVEGIEGQVVQDLYQCEQLYVVATVNVVGGSVQSSYDVFETLDAANNYFEAENDVTEAQFTTEQLKQLDDAYIDAGDGLYDSLVVQDHHLIKRNIERNNKTAIGHIEYANKCSNSDHCVTINTVYVYDNDQHWKKTVKTWKYMHVYNNVDACVSAAKSLVAINQKMLETVI